MSALGPAGSAGGRVSAACGIAVRVAAMALWVAWSGGIASTGNALASSDRSGAEPATPGRRARSTNDS